LSPRSAGKALAAEKADDWHWLLRLPRERPRRRCAAEKGDEVASVAHSITLIGGFAQSMDSRK
jgi:hypothetical protein